MSSELLDEIEDRETWWRGVVERDIFPDFVPMSDERAKEISEYTKEHFLKRSDIPSAEFSERREQFIEEVLPNLLDDSPRKIMWGVSRDLERIKRRFIEHIQTDDDIDDEVLIKTSSLLRDVYHIYSGVKIDTNKGMLLKSRFSRPLKDVEHCMNNRGGLFRISLKDYLDRGGSRETTLEDYKYVASYLSKLLPEHIKWIDEVVVLDVDHRMSINSIRAILDSTLWLASDVVFVDEEPQIFSSKYQNPRKSPKHFIDTYRFLSMCENVLMNAKLHSGISPSEIVINSWCGFEEESWSLVVGNTGKGFDERMLEDDAEYGQRAFRRGEKSKETGGTGMGLALVHEWVKEMGGKVWCGNLDDPFSPEGKIAYVAMEMPIKVEV